VHINYRFKTKQNTFSQNTWYLYLFSKPKPDFPASSIILSYCTDCNCDDFSIIADYLFLSYGKAVHELRTTEHLLTPHPSSKDVFAIAFLILSGDLIQCQNTKEREHAYFPIL